MALPPQSEKVLAAALDAAAVVVVVLDRSGRPAYVNNAACELTGYTADQPRAATHTGAGRLPGHASAGLRAPTVVERVAPAERAEAEQVLERMWRGDLPS